MFIYHVLILAGFILTTAIAFNSSRTIATDPF